MLSIVGIAYSEKVATLRPIAAIFDRLAIDGNGVSNETQKTLETGLIDGSKSTDSNYTGLERKGEEDNSEASRSNAGILWALVVGLAGGSVLAPLHYVPNDQKGFVFIPSFGIGAIVFSPAVFLFSAWLTSEWPPLHLREALPMGLMSGLLWNIGNILSVVAIPILGYGVAYPFLQCAVLVSGVWGIYVFREIIETRVIVVFWVAGIVLLTGAALLAVAQ